ncbi:MarR family winged helix-turn-helix transcriptional regulator [Calidifontibacter terrae]
MTAPQDSVDHHVARWAALWEDNPDFDPEVEGAITRMQTLMRRLRRVDAAAYADSDLTAEDVNTLHNLMIQPYPGEATPTQLAEASGITKAAMTGRLDRLEKAGLVTRETDGANRRRVIVRPTRQGRRVWESKVHEGMRREQELLGGLSAKEMVALNVLLRKAIQHLE